MTCRRAAAEPWWSTRLRRRPSGCFGEYLKLGSVHALEAWLKQQGIVSKQFASSAGRTIGGVPFNRGAPYHLLRNPVYLGRIRHKGQCHAGQHAPIVEQALFDKVQSTLDAKRRRYAERTSERFSAPLAGRIFDALGEPMSPTVSRGKLGKRYRYYVSAPLQQGGRAKPKTSPQRLDPADLCRSSGGSAQRPDRPPASSLHHQSAGHAMADLDARYLPVCHRSPETQYGRRLIGLAFLAPDLQQAILDGSQPADLTLEHLLAKPLPAEWAAQRQLFDHV